MASSIRPGATVEAEAWLRRKLVANRAYWPYWAGNVASWGGLGMADVLLLYLVFEMTGSALAVAYVGLAASIPVLVIGLPAGVIADRYNRRTLLIATALLQAAALGAVPLSMLLVGFQLVPILCLVFLLEAVTAVFRPSANAILPNLVHSATLDDANGLLQASTAVASTAGAAGGAFLLVEWGTYPAFALGVGVFLLSGLLLTRIPLLPGVEGVARRAAGAASALVRDLEVAFSYLRQHRALLELTFISIGLGFFLAVATPFLVVYTVQGLGQPATAFGYLVAGFSGGFFVGSVATGRLGVLRHLGWVLVTALWVGGGLFGVLVLVPWFVVAGPTLVSLGLLFGVVTTAFFSYVQRVVPSGLLGRYLSIDETVSLAMTPVGIVVGGLLISSYGVGVAFGVTALGLLGTGAIALGLVELRSLKFDTGPEPVTVPRTTVPGTMAEELPSELPGHEALSQPTPVGDEIRP